MAADGGPQGLALVARLKAASYSAIVPVAVLTGRQTTERVQEGFTAGADEVITPLFEPAEQASRLDGLMARTARDVAVNPSTRLPGTTEIEREIRHRMENGELFAVCYADLDHFKEYNDRYSYNDGDRVIYILSRILHDVVKGILARRGFVGHIGGDDFIFIIPFDAIPDVCGEVLDVFDTLIPYQYNEQDRRAGYYFGKDRRGQLHRVPLMTLSIGIVTNQHRRFAHPAQVSELPTDMQTYPKPPPRSPFLATPHHAAPSLAPRPPARPTAPRAGPAGAPPGRPAAPPAAPAPRAASPPVPAPRAPAAPAVPAGAAPGQRMTSPLRPVNPFMVQDPKQKARRLARALVSDLVVYHPEKRQQGLRDGTLPQLFKDEIEKSWQEYVEQVGAELAKTTAFWAEALNEILAGGNKVF